MFQRSHHWQGKTYRYTISNAGMHNYFHCALQVTHYFTVTPLNIISAWQTFPSILFIISSQKVLRLLLWTNREWNNSLRPTGACSNSCNHRQVCFYDLHSTAWRKVLGVNWPVSWGLSVWRWWCSGHRILNIKVNGCACNVMGWWAMQNWISG